MNTGQKTILMIFFFIFLRIFGEELLPSSKMKFLRSRFFFFFGIGVFKLSFLTAYIKKQFINASKNNKWMPV